MLFLPLQSSDNHALTDYLFKNRLIYTVQRYKKFLICNNFVKNLWIGDLWRNTLRERRKAKGKRQEACFRVVTWGGELKEFREIREGLRALR